MPCFRGEVVDLLRENTQELRDFSLRSVHFQIRENNEAEKILSHSCNIY
jgi:hypothetical protein